MSSTGEQLLGLVTESGEFQFISDVGFQYVGTLSASGNAVSDAFVAFGDDGAFAGNASMSGTVQSRVSMSGNTSFTPVGGAIVNSTVTLS